MFNNKTHPIRNHDATTRRIIPALPPASTVAEENLDVWGFKDSGFAVNDNGDVEVRGSRYAAGGDILTELLPWVREVFEAPVTGEDQNPGHYPPQIPDPITNKRFLTALKKILPAEQYSDNAELRLRHGHGHTQEEMYAIKYGQIPRIPDLVVWPNEEAQVVALVKTAAKHNICLIPYGGGTNVTNALICPEDEERMIVSIDMQQMNRILWIDPVDHTACIQAGAIGRNITSQLAEHGYTMGHEPDSVEFSTLGGWIATNASGMKKNRYGNIEQIVQDFRLVTANGDILERLDSNPRESTGADPRRWLFGSEGNAGIITCAIVKLFPLPPVQRYGSVLFKNFEIGTEFMYDLARSGNPPASVRLVDNRQFQLSMALKPPSTGLKKLKSTAEKLLVTKALGFEPDEMVACTLVFEGTEDEVSIQEKNLYAIAKKHGGMKAGGANGERGYQLTFAIAYIRDFIMNHWLIAESFETSVPWSGVLPLCERVKQRINDEYAARQLPGKPFITCRVTQVYDTGACIYFYFAFYYKGVENPSEVFSELEHAARDEVLKAGGSLSHHHGIGKIRAPFLRRIQSESLLDWNRGFKQAIDPNNLFGAHNHMPGEAE